MVEPCRRGFQKICIRLPDAWSMHPPIHSHDLPQIASKWSLWWCLYQRPVCSVSRDALLYVPSRVLLCDRQFQHRGFYYGNVCTGLAWQRWPGSNAPVRPRRYPESDPNDSSPVHFRSCAILAAIRKSANYHVKPIDRWHERLPRWPMHCGMF